jgi:hypothetical protein
LALLSKIKPPPDARVGHAETPSFSQWRVTRSGGTELCDTTSLLDVNTAIGSLSGEQKTRLALLLTFCDPMPRQCLQMLALSMTEWERLLRWLDLSGLALYFLNRLVELDLCDLLPTAVFNRLYLNLIDNTQRTRGMVSESIAIQKKFLKAGLSYANLKGLSLCPNSVSKPELRCQFDLDFLVAEESAPEARRILERRGYRLYAISGRSWEFKLNERPGIALKDIYRDLRSHAVELHLEPSVRRSLSTLERLEWRELHGLTMPVLSPIDLFLGQGLHVFKHLCGESTRTAHLLEFRQHVLSRRDDDSFWSELQVLARDNPRASEGLGVVILLITCVMGDFAPKALTGWTVDCLSRPVRLWVETYGHRVALGNFPGTKLYLLLRKELESATLPEKPYPRRALFPSRLPPPVIRAFPNEALPVRIRRYSMYLQLVLDRLHFHVVEGFRFALESRRWQRKKECAQ